MEVTIYGWWLVIAYSIKIKRNGQVLIKSKLNKEFTNQLFFPQYSYYSG
jgi:hypothetical protein